MLSLPIIVGRIDSRRENQGILLVVHCTRYIHEDDGLRRKTDVGSWKGQSF